MPAADKNKEAKQEPEAKEDAPKQRELVEITDKRRLATIRKNFFEGNHTPNVAVAIYGDETRAWESADAE